MVRKVWWMWRTPFFRIARKVLCGNSPKFEIILWCIRNKCRSAMDTPIVWFNPTQVHIYETQSGMRSMNTQFLMSSSTLRRLNCTRDPIRRDEKTNGGWCRGFPGWTHHTNTRLTLNTLLKFLICKLDQQRCNPPPGSALP